MAADALVQVRVNLLTYSQNGAVTNFNNTLASLTATQKAQIGTQTYDQCLFNITRLTNVTSVNSMTLTLAKVAGAYLSPDAIGFAMEDFAFQNNYTALDSLTDYLTATQKANIGAWHIDNTLDLIARNDNPSVTTDDPKIATAVRDLMTKLGAYASPDSIGLAMENFAFTKNYGALDAVTDFLTGTQKANIGAWHIDNTLDLLARNDDPGIASDNAAIADATRDLMVKVGTLASAFEVNMVAENFLFTKNYDAADAMLDNLTGAQYTEVNAHRAEYAQFGVTLGTSAANTLNGNANNNVIYGLNGNDTINGNDGNDRLYGDSGSDWLDGGNGNDTLFGGIGNDVLIGGAGDDTLRGGRGADDMTGGAGADTFVFDRTDLGTGVDRIADFNRTGGDKIDISDVLETYNAGDVLSDFVQITYNSGVATLSVDVNGAAGGANFAAVTTIVGLASGTTAEQLATLGNLVV